MTLDDDEKNQMVAKLVFPRETVLINFDSQEKCETFKKLLQGIEENLANTFGSTHEDGLKEPTKVGTLMKRPGNSKNFAPVYIKLKGDSLFFYDNEKSKVPNSFARLDGVVILWAENKANIENVIEFVKPNDNNFKPFFLYSQKFDILKSWLLALSETSVIIDAYVKESYMQQLSNPLFFKVTCT